ncbi:MAG: hypothetical protein ACK49R_01735 [Planctomycetota bacterium]
MSFRKSRRRRGLVLIVVTVLLLLISLGTLGLVSMVQTEYRATRLRGVELELENSAAAGREYLLALASQSRSTQVSLGGLTANRELVLNRSRNSTAEEVSEIRFSITPQGIPASGDENRLGPVNESAKLHLEQLLRWDREQPGTGFQALMNLPGMTSDVADAILDWVDADSTPRTNGAEADRYASMGLSYSPRNAVPPVLDELLLIPGVTAELLLGESSTRSNSGSGTNPDARPTRPSRSKSLAPRAGIDANPRPWRDFLTVSSRERNENFEGQPRHYLNHPALVELHQQITDRLGSTWANYVIAWRQLGPYRGRRGTTIEAWQPDLNQPARFNFTSELELVGSRVPVSRENRSTKTLDSPLSAERVGWTGELSRVLDEVSIDKSNTLPGRVNIELAPREVLIGIPGMDVVMVDRILSSRTLSADGSHSHAHPAWLLEQGIVDLPMMSRLLPRVTTGGDVWSGEIAAWQEDYSLLIRDEFIIDAAGKTGRQLYCKDLRDRAGSLPPEPSPAAVTQTRN